MLVEKKQLLWSHNTSETVWTELHGIATVRLLSAMFGGPQQWGPIHRQTPENGGTFLLFSTYLRCLYLGSWHTQIEITRFLMLVNFVYLCLLEKNTQQKYQNPQKPTESMFVRTSSWTLDGQPAKLGLQLLTWYCWWFRIPAITRKLIYGDSTSIYKILYIPSAGFLNHQQ